MASRQEPRQDTFLRRAQGKECPPLRSSSPRPLRNYEEQEPCATTAAHEAQLRTLARMLGCVSASTSQGSTGPHLRSASGHRVWAAARAHHTATFACPSACRTWRQPINTTCGVSWRLRRPGTTPSWRKWRQSSGNLPSLQSLSRPLGLGAREDWLTQPTESATPTPLRPQRHQVTSFRFHFQLGAPPRAALFLGRVGPSLWHVSLLFHVVSLPCWGRPSGCMIPKSLGPDPVMSAFPASICTNPLLRG